MDQESPDVVFQFDIPAVFKYLSVISNSLTAILEQVEGIPERDILTYNVLLAIHEVCANIVEHAYAGAAGRIKIIIRLEEPSGRLTVDLYDTGQTFDLAAAPRPDLDSVPMRGYGLFLVQELMDEVFYHPQPGKNHWRLVKTLL